MSRSSSNEPAWRGPSLPTPALQHPGSPHCLRHVSSVPCATPLVGVSLQGWGCRQESWGKAELGMPVRSPREALSLQLRCPCGLCPSVTARGVAQGSPVTVAPSGAIPLCSTAPWRQKDPRDTGRETDSVSVCLSICLPAGGCWPLPLHFLIMNFYSCPQIPLQGKHQKPGAAQAGSAEIHP